MTELREAGPTNHSGPTIETATLGTAWLGVAREILAGGAPSRYDGLPVLEIAMVTLSIDSPDSGDPVILELAEPDRLAWMHANFVDHSRVQALGNARSYASRLYDYAASGRDQVAWVIDRLRNDPTSRSATITTFEPLIDTSYIPCVSLLDFWIRDGAVELISYAHSIDFGAKGYGNLVELAYLQERVAGALGLPVGGLVFIVKSAHVYDTERQYMHAVLAAAERLAAG
jgi:thymidylate synthase